MTIYRGSGGGGNATTDSEVALLTQLEQSASASASAAAASAVAADASADAAALSASDADTSADAAAASAAAASASALAADASADAAAVSETNAAASESSAAAIVATIDTATIVRTTGDQNIGGTKTFSNTISGSITGNAGTVTNGVYTTDIGTLVPSYSSTTLKTSSTGSSVLPVGTTAQRDGSPSAGYIRFNTTITKFEGYTGSAWSSVGGGATGGGADEIFIENGQTVTANYTVPSGRNAVSTGPITVNSGVTVTVSSGSRWVVL